MKILIAANYKALRTGEFVSVNEDNEEFIVDTDDCELSKAVLVEVAKKNKIKIGKKDNAATLLEKLEEGFIELGLPEQNEMSDTDKIKAVIAAGVEAGKDDEEMIVEIIQKGIKYKAAIKAFNNEMQAGGYRITAAKRKEQVRDILVEDEFEPEDYDAVTDMLEKIVKTVADTETPQAMKIMRGYCKEFEIELPKPPKKPRGGLKQQIINWITANPSANEEELTSFIVDEKEKDAKYVPRYLAFLTLANTVYENATADEGEED